MSKCAHNEGKYGLSSTVIAALTSVLLSGCVSPGQQSSANSASAPLLPTQSLALFSTYASDAMSLQCQQSRAVCEEDMVAPDAFLSALEQVPGNLDILADTNQPSDYELLIANLGRAETLPWWQALLTDTSAPSTQFSEFTLTWRGIELSSTIISQQFSATASDNQMASQLLHQWWDIVNKDAIFSASYLYQQLNASNYRDELHLPISIDMFRQTITELYSDPLEGIISRYTHPEFNEALLDISVYPIRQPLTANTTDILDDELNNDLTQAEQVANARTLTLSLIHSPEDTDMATSQGKGRRLALEASSPTSDTIYASIYVFRLQDKIVKFTTTMPPRFSDALVRQAVPHIKVPRESGLMTMLRAKSHPAVSAGGR